MMDQNQLESQIWVFYKLNYQKMEKQNDIFICKI